MGSKSNDSKSKASSDVIKLNIFRDYVRQFTELNLWPSALFWADKVLAANKCLGGNDVWLVAKCMLQKGDYHRAIHTITSRNLHTTHLLCHYVAALAMLEAKEYQEALQLLSDNDPNTMSHNLDDIPKNRALAAVYVAKGSALSALERRGAASDNLLLALRTDVCCSTALEMLLDQHAFTFYQERSIVDTLPYERQCSPAEAIVLQEVYHSMVDRYGPDFRVDTDGISQMKMNALDVDQAHSYGDVVLPDVISKQEALNNMKIYSMDMICAEARRLLHKCQFSSCLSLIELTDPWAWPELKTACLVELGKAPALFAFAHALVDRYPNLATSWFAVGCYYYLIGKNEFARRYLSKATSLDRGMGAAWLAYGHSFAADNEHDQAMAAYFKASQLLPGCHLPQLYIGVECAITNNERMAARFLAAAARGGAAGTMPGTILDATAPSSRSSHHRSGRMTNRADRNASKDKQTSIIKLSDSSQNISPEPTISELLLEVGEIAPDLVNDPHVAHEAGVAAYRAENYEEAEKLWRRALKQVESPSGMVPERWQPLLNNLGHACRKNRKYVEALKYHKMALCTRPTCPATYAAIGFNYAMLEKTTAAIDAFHSCISKNPCHSVASSMLSLLMETFSESISSDDTVPEMYFPERDIKLNLPPPEALPDPSNLTCTSDMSMSFDD